MSEIPHLQWSNSISVRVDSIDAQHKKLFDITNSLIDIFEAGSGEFLTVISELVEYTTIHFHDEQMVMMNAKFPGLAAHMVEHNKFIAKVEEFLQAYGEGQKDIGRTMIVFLRDWLFAHTSGLDMEFAQFLAKKPAK
ncbi:MAG TPA: bacteriohemerythrin [Smithellaceae bacterium]|nr:bacteriohemerythrin [Smithellaceae bacterium]HRS83313.1 bacteriohemerythrin [Smithellaceae bacterium]HRV44323.1 bacteriohemerythrin [Smithellaceae bacterium]